MLEDERFGGGRRSGDVCVGEIKSWGADTGSKTDRNCSEQLR